MQVKVFEAADMASGLRKIRRELGPDALILSTRTVKNGAMGMLGKQTLEITAAIDNQWPAQPVKEQNPQQTNQTQAFKAYHTTGSLPNPKPRHNPAGKEAALEVTAPEDKNLSSSSENPALRQEFDELKNLVKSLAGEISKMSTEAPGQQKQTPQPSLASLEFKLRASRKNDHIQELLLQHGINYETSEVITNFAREHLSESEQTEAATLYPFLHSTIADIFTVNPPVFGDKKQQKKMALLGPTGVGKTTTLAKIAARYLASVSSSIALITVDTYRIAAVEQLKVYGEIMHLPVEVVISPQQLNSALEKHSDKELVLIDTAGRSPLDNLSLADVKTFFPEELGIENHLVLSAATRDQELLETLNAFKPFSISSTIFTKIDECTNLGVLLNTQIQNSSPVSYLTNGQRVPEDIMEADKQSIAQLIIPPATA